MAQRFLAPLREDALMVGVMSGTSADGVDVAVCRLSGRPAGPWGTLLRHGATPYTSDLRDRIHHLRQVGGGSLADLARITRDLTLVHAAAVREALDAAGIAPEEVEAVADHGQTVYHAPPVTLQLLDPSLLAAKVGAPVVSDFRRADCAAGGQGAPLVPYADLRLFAHPARTRVLLNLGGIANITILRPGSSEPVAFDTGPANCLSDHLCRKLDPAGLGYDASGQLAATGTPDLEVVRTFLMDAYLCQPPPKSTDGPAMVDAFERACGRVEGRTLPDLLATATECVAASVAATVAPLGKVDLIASGGGTRHGLLMSRLRALCPQAAVTTTDDHGVPSEAKEAIAFALLGLATLRGEPGNVPSATGARRAVVLGSLTPVP